MADRRTPEQFRKWLLVELASTHWPRHIAIYGADDGDEKYQNLAVRLGVQEAVLAEAIDLVRFGFRTTQKKNIEPELSKRVAFRMKYPSELMKLVTNLGVVMNCTPTTLVRNLMHAAMQTTHEPTLRVRGRQRKRAVLRGKVLSGHIDSYLVRLSRALKQAIQCRALAYGESPHAYVRAWLIDLVEGKLGHIDIQPVRIGQMFDSVEAYVLPVLEQKP